MDPKECLRLADQAISDGDYAAAREHLENYRAWRAKGGFEPTDAASSGKAGDEFARYCRRRLEDCERSDASPRQLTDSDTGMIADALRNQAELYKNNAIACRKANQSGLAQQFETQRAQAEGLATLLGDYPDVIVTR